MKTPAETLPGITALRRTTTGRRFMKSGTTVLNAMNATGVSVDEVVDWQILYGSCSLRYRGQGWERVLLTDNQLLVLVRNIAFDVTLCETELHTRKFSQLFIINMNS